MKSVHQAVFVFLAFVAEVLLGKQQAGQSGRGMIFLTLACSFDLHAASNHDLNLGLQVNNLGANEA